MFYTLSSTDRFILGVLKLSSANAVRSDKSRIESSGKDLNLHKNLSAVLTHSMPLMTQEDFLDSVDQDQTTQNDSRL